MPAIELEEVTMVEISDNDLEANGGGTALATNPPFTNLAAENDFVPC